MQDFPTAPDNAALFLDFDGTLVEIAERPDAVRVPPDLPPLLERLSRHLDGALAIVSGRPLAELDHFLPGPVAKAGNHGAALRRRPDGAVESPALASPPAAWRARTQALTEAFPSAFIEDKAHGFVLHYRQAPEAGAVFRDLLESLVAEAPEHFALLPARMAWEVTPRGVSKATAVTSLMAHPPFAGRVPVFVGDDVTDEAGMQAAREAGGIGLRLQDAFGTPGDFRAWLAALEARYAQGRAA
ncbi:trehalose-phosphatase [Falsiroseomonas selenitidurans]|uniref:Trehalose 6-phosphate phosphatase n=1 Tax=Falsiroseomonas selenitidurans TaxID=2716335 RepID=A0ABX1DX60_9PROT|nr:trehalose-phosphatase [Falsiroseomonas selenitidurans]NKC29469.1 trehalose-phosphatase [Falsiroseomonas selenitidurans]